MQRLIVFAKEPRPGAVKTRLARTLGDEPAARLYDAFLHDTLDVCRAADLGLCVAFTPTHATAWFGELAPDAVLMPQPEGDLGERLEAAVEAGFRLGSEGVLVTGSDLPHMEPADLERARRAVSMGRAALGPTSDGGFWLVGLPRAVPGLFDRIPWSTERVLGRMLDHLEREGLEIVRLSTTFDIDVAADLERLRAHLAALPPERCPHTRAALAPA